MLTATLPTGNPAGLSLVDRRRIQVGMVAKSAAGVARVGVLPTHTNPLVTGKASMGYDLLPFVAVTSRQAGGVEFVSNDGSAPIAPAGYAAPNANSRLDVIWVRSRFTAFGDAANTPEIGLTQGVPNFNPQKPTIPAGALEFAVAEVKSTDETTQTVVITQTVPYTALEGGDVLLRNQAEQDAWAPHDGARAYRLDTDTQIHRADGAWVRDKPSPYRFVRDIPFDAPVTSGTYIGLVEGTIPNAPAGLYMVTARASLYANAGSPVVGRIYAEWGPSGAPTREQARWDLPNVGAYPTSPQVIVNIVHAGGDLRVAAGYRRDSGAFAVTGQESGETVVTATYLGGA
jgi:hypothetical protein